MTNWWQRLFSRMGAPAGASVSADVAALKVIVDAIQADIGDPSARTNLQTLIAMLGNPDTAGKTLYDNVGDFVGLTNFASLLALLGVPDVAGKDLYTVLVTDLLAHGTYGLAALETLVDDLETRCTLHHN